MQSPAAARPPFEALVAELEDLELARRAIDARTLRLIGNAVDEATRPVHGTLSRYSSDLPVTEAPNELVYRSLRAELATTLGQSEYVVERQMDLACRIMNEYSNVLETLEHGGISLEHARVIAHEGVIIGVGTHDPSVAERSRGYEQEILEVAVVETPGRLRPIAKMLAERWAETCIEVRHEQARSVRRISVVDAEDGMADLIVRMSAIQAYAIRDRVTRLARSVRQGERFLPADKAGPDAEDKPRDRTQEQTRTDVVVDLLLGADPYELASGCPAEAIDARVQFIAPIEVAEIPEKVQNRASDDRILEDLLGELVGYGAVSMIDLHEHAAVASHHEKITADKVNGEVLSVDRYRPSTEMRRLIGARDRRCRFPGCRVPVHRCDIDHTIDAALGGPTSTDNLASLCRGHHVLKHQSEWKVRQENAGVLRWTSPAGREHLDRPPGMLAPPLKRRSRVRFDPE